MVLYLHHDSAVIKFEVTATLKSIRVNSYDRHGGCVLRRSVLSDRVSGHVLSCLTGCLAILSCLTGCLAILSCLPGCLDTTCPV